MIASEILFSFFVLVVIGFFFYSFKRYVDLLEKFEKEKMNFLEKLEKLEKEESLRDKRESVLIERTFLSEEDKKVKNNNDIEKTEVPEVPLSETARIPIVDGVKIKFEDEEESFPININ